MGEASDVATVVEGRFSGSPVSTGAAISAVASMPIGFESVKLLGSTASSCRWRRDVDGRVEGKGEAGGGVLQTPDVWFEQLLCSRC